VVAQDTDDDMYDKSLAELANVKLNSVGAQIRKREYEIDHER
jgi:hypothetical protein